MRDVRDFKDFRAVLMAAICDLASEHPEVLMLDADLSSCISSTTFQKQFPDRFFNCGIAEANMVAMAGGLSSMGFVPFAHSFGCFASRRTYDQFFLSVAYAKQRVILIGSDAGITAQLNGGTHMPLEDIALMRQIPDLVVIEPSDGQSMYALTRALYDSGKAGYIRTPRKGVVHRYTPETEIVLGKGIELADGKDIAIIATGEVMVSGAVEAAAILKEKGIDATVVDLHTIKPLDTELIAKVAQRCGKVLVCENGRYAGGTGEAIAAFLAKTNPTRMDFLNVGEQFGEVGKLPYLKATFGFTAENIAAKAEALCK